MASIRPVILATDDDARLDEPLYAINLLNRVRPWAYDTYNLLAYPVAKRVGARPLIKGVDGELIGGEGEVRETILLVGYGDATSFLKMARHPWFVVISALRKFGFDGFQFAFSKRLDGGPSRPPGGRSGEILALFWPEDAEVDLADLRLRVSAAGSTLTFIAAKKAILAVDKDDGRGARPTRLAPPLPYGHVAVITGHPRTLTPLADELPDGASHAVRYRRTL
ncbi:MAG: hypothetical protein AAGM22_32575 [Acidobacteriota bacterium]